MADDTATWSMIHAERAALSEDLAELTPGHWATPSLCHGWTVQLAAAHVVAGAEQTPANFAKGMARNGFRFNTMIDRDAHALGTLTPTQIIERLQLRTSTTNRPPAPATAMLGEVVVHREDILRPVGRRGTPTAAAVNACLDMYTTASFPVGGKKRIRGLRLVATDTGWSHGDGPEVAGPGIALVLAMTGRSAGLDELSGEGAALLRTRVHPD
ncbi:MAG TPA: maleylpyruvate isomerase family mycothiol-dependent enzyme [Mycobacteriales bacterium]|jgi:uncharacterized protein (TIGR03083 family)|nr:maleylpyruvate isomerase family mycothiol-dependent enzyme [Mycobacteriales bacterium]